MLAEEENFKYTDTNRDGELDASEVLKWVHIFSVTPYKHNLAVSGSNSPPWVGAWMNYT